MSNNHQNGGFGIPPEVLANINVPDPNEYTRSMPDDTTYVKAEIITNDANEKKKWEQHMLKTQEAKVPKRINKPIKQTFFDVEPRWQADKVNKRKSWPEFCRDFLAQNYGSIAQALLELYQKDKNQFLKYMLEMGKQGYPQAMQLELSKPQENVTDIYGALKSMSNPLLPQENSSQLNTPKEDCSDNQNEGDDIFGSYVIDPDAEGITEVEYVDGDEDENNRHTSNACEMGNTDDIDQCKRCHKIYQCGMPIAHYAMEMRDNEKPKRSRGCGEVHEAYKDSDLFSQFSSMDSN